MEIEEYSGPMPEFVERGEEGSDLDDGNDDVIPDAEDDTMPVEQPTGAALSPQHPENEQITTQPAEEPMQIDPVLIGLDPQLSNAAETGMAEQVDSNTGIAASAESENGVAGGSGVPEVDASMAMPSAESAASPINETAPIPAADSTTAITAGTAHESATVRQSPPIKQEPTTPAPAAPSAPSPTNAPGPGPAPPAAPAPTLPLAPQSAVQDHRSAYDVVMDEMMTTGHPHAVIFNQIRRLLGDGVVIGTEGQNTLIRDQLGNVHRVPTRDVDRVQAEALGVQPSQYEIERARRTNRQTLEERLGGSVEREAAEHALGERLGGQGMLADRGEEGDGEAEDEEDSQGDIQLPGW